MILYLLIVLFIVGLLVGCGSWSSSLAKSKGRDGAPWFVLGVLLGPIGVLVSGLVNSGAGISARTDIPPI